MANIKISELGLAPSIADVDNLVIVHSGKTEKTTAKLLFNAAVASNSLATTVYVDTAIAKLIDNSPVVLDTLNELAAALANNPKFAKDITALIGTKLNSADFIATANTWVGTKTTNAVAEGSSNLYYTGARANSDFDTRLATKSTTNLVEGTNLYYTNARASAAAKSAIGINDSNLSYLNGIISTNPNSIYNYIQLEYAPTSAKHAARKGYVDGAITDALNSSAFTATADTWIGTKTTDAVAEGSVNLYFKTDRARAAIGVSGALTYSNGVIDYTEPANPEYATVTLTGAIVEPGQAVTKEYVDNQVNGTILASTIEGEELDFTGNSVNGVEISTPGLKAVAFSGSYYDLIETPVFFDGNYDNLTHKPNLNDILAPVAFTGNINSLTGNLSADKIIEGNTNKFYNNRKVDDRLVKFIETRTTDILAEGTHNLYFTTGRVVSALSSATTDDLPESKEILGRKYYSDALVDNRLAMRDIADRGWVNTRIADLVDSTPEIIGTLKQLKDEISNLPDTITAITTVIAGKLNTNDFASTANTWLGAKSTTDLAEGANKYYSDARARSAIGVTGGGSYNSTTGIITIPNGFSGSYSDLTGKPVLFSGSYSDLTGKPVLFSGSYSDLTNKPSLTGYATEAFVTGQGYLTSVGTISYDDLTNKPVLFTGSYTNLTNRPTLFSGSYSDLTNKPSNPEYATVTLTGPIIAANQAVTKEYVDNKTNSSPISSTDDLSEGTVNLYFTQTRARNSLSAGSGINYNPVTGEISSTSTTATSTVDGGAVTFTGDAVNGVETGTVGFAVVALSGSYNDLSNKPALFDGNYNSLTNKPNLDLAPVAFTGAFADLTGKPTSTDIAEGITQGANLYWTNQRFNDSFETKTTADLAESQEHKYYSDERARHSISAGAGIEYDESSGKISTGFPRLPNFVSDNLANISLVIQGGPAPGHIYFNTTESKIKFYNGTIWVAIG